MHARDDETAGLPRGNEALRRENAVLLAAASLEPGWRGRGRAEEAVDRFTVAFEESAVGQALISLDGHFLRVNGALAAMLGLAPAALEGRAFNDVTHPEDRAAGTGAVELLLAGKKTVRFEQRYLAQSGATIWVDVNIALVHDPHRRPLYLVGTYVDLTERKRVESQLVASETRYRRVFEAAQDGVLILDATSGAIVDVNPYLLGLIGYSREALLGKRLWEIGPFKDIVASQESFARLQSEKYVRYEDLPLQASDGRKIEVEFVSNVYLVDDQEVIQCNIRDVFARKRAEIVSERLATAVAQSADMVAITDTAGYIVYINPAFEEVTGYTRAEILGRNASVLGSGAQDASFYRGLWETIGAGKTWRGRMVNRKKDGTLYTEDSSISPVCDAAGVTTSFVAVKRDITRSLELETQFLQAQKMEGIGRLAGGVAHDFNNLLAVILSYTGFAMEELRQGDPLLDDLTEINKAAGRAAVLTRQLLAFSRKQVLRPVAVNLGEIAAGVEKMLGRILGEDIELVSVLAPDLGLTLADPGQIEQVLMNLVVNARDAMPEGGKVTIETRNLEIDEEYAARHVAVTPGPYVMLAVTDTGSGMTAQIKGRIFEPFYTTKEQGKGTGLGLSTVYGIVKQSGGDVWVHSEPGRGTTVKIYLPRALDATAATTTRPPRSRGRPTGTETILVVEDEEALRIVAERTLTAAGYKVLTAAAGDEALLTSARHEGVLDLLLTDVVMPRMGGRALVHALAKARPGIRVLFMSGYTDDAVVRQGVLEAGTNFLAKPFTALELAWKVREVLDADVSVPVGEHARPVE